MTKEEKDIERKKQLQKELSKIYDAERKIEIQKRLERARGLIGKCFKFRNGAAGSNWWLYSMVTGYDKGGYLEMVSFEKILTGGLEIRREQHFGDHLMQISITRKEFNNRFKRHLAKITDAIGKE